MCYHRFALQFPVHQADWNVNHVVDWLKTLGLVGDYSQTVKDKKINGKGLLLIAKRKQWADFGFGEPIDVLAIEDAMEVIQSL